MNVDELLAVLIEWASYRQFELQYYWLDVCVVAQTDNVAMSSDIKNISTIIKSIGWTLLVLDGELSALGRIWCIFEIMTTLRECGPDRLLMHNSETRPMYAYLTTHPPYHRGGSDAEYERLWFATLHIFFARNDALAARAASVDVRSAQAKYEEDRVRVMAEVRKFGIDTTNRMLRQAMLRSTLTGAFEALWRFCLQRFFPIFELLDDGDLELWMQTFRDGGWWLSLRPTITFLLRLCPLARDGAPHSHGVLVDGRR